MTNPIRNTDAGLGFNQTPLEDLRGTLIKHYRKQVPHLKEVEAHIKDIYERISRERQNAESNLESLEMAGE